MQLSDHPDKYVQDQVLLFTKLYGGSNCIFSAPSPLQLDAKEYYIKYNNKCTNVFFLFFFNIISNEKLK